MSLMCHTEQIIKIVQEFNDQIKSANLFSDFTLFSQNQGYNNPFFHQTCNTKTTLDIQKQNTWYASGPHGSS